MGRALMIRAWPDDDARSWTSEVALDGDDAQACASDDEHSWDSWVSDLLVSPLDDTEPPPVAAAPRPSLAARQHAVEHAFGEHRALEVRSSDREAERLFAVANSVAPQDHEPFTRGYERVMPRWPYVGCGWRTRDGADAVRIVRKTPQALPSSRISLPGLPDGRVLVRYECVLIPNGASDAHPCVGGARHSVEAGIEDVSLHRAEGGAECTLTVGVDEALGEAVPVEHGQVFLWRARAARDTQIVCQVACRLEEEAVPTTDEVRIIARVLEEWGRIAAVDAPLAVGDFPRERLREIAEEEEAPHPTGGAATVKALGKRRRA